MRRLLAGILIFILFTGCTPKDKQMDRALLLRQKLLSDGCSFDAEITADYGSAAYVFAMHCVGAPDGSLTFTVTEPECIRDITGKIEQDSGKLTFDGMLLAFSMLADGQVTPVSAPWIMYNTLRGGRLTSCGVTDGGLSLALDDSYRENPLHLDVQTDGEDKPVLCEILWKNRRILTLRIRNFTFS